MGFRDVDWKGILLNKTFLMSILGIVLIIFLFVSIIIPGYRGYKIYSALNGKVSENYITNITLLTQDKAKAESLAIDAQNSVIDAQKIAKDAKLQMTLVQEKYDKCVVELESSKNQSKILTKSLAEDVSKLTTDVAACKSQLGEVESKDAIINDAARRLCCMQRVDNPSINSYSLTNDKISCQKDGTLKLNC